VENPLKTLSESATLFHRIPVDSLWKFLSGITIENYCKSTDTADVSKISDSENTPKNLENMCNSASIFLIPERRGNMKFV